MLANIHRLLIFILILPLFTLAQSEPQVIPLWKNGAPGFENRRDIPEMAQDYWVRNINNPSVTVYLPAPGKANGCAVIVAPGGGFRELVFNAEGKGIFNEKCVLCHELDQLKIGPPLRNITKDRAPEYIMNLLLNTAGMQKDDPSVRALIKKYNNIVMISPELNEAKARSVLEYLRSVAK